MQKSFSRLLGFLLAFAAGTLMQACDRPAPFKGPEAKSESEDQSPVVASVDGKPIRLASVRRELLRHGADFAENTSEIASSHLEPLIRRRVLSIAAREAGFDRDPEIAEEVDALLASRFWSRHLEALEPLVVTDDEVRQYYEANHSEFRDAERVRGSMVFLSVAADAAETERRAVRDEAFELRKAANGPGGVFSSLARQRSEDARSRERGGDIGWLVVGARTHRVERPVVEALERLRTSGTIGGPIETRRGVYLVQLTDRSGGEMRPLSAVGAAIRARILAAKQQARSAEEYAKLRRRYTVELDSMPLEQLASKLVAGSGQGPPAFPIGVKVVPPPREEAAQP